MVLLEKTNKETENGYRRDNQMDPFSAGTVFRRQNLTSVDVRFWRLKTIPALKEWT